MSPFSDEVERAIETCLVAHHGQCRKGSEVPYAGHPFHVALILARLGADDATVQAALLHDVVEDCEGWDRERIVEHFGADVAELVAQLTEDKTLSWEERKGAWIGRLASMDERAVAVKAADKLHNLSTLVRDLRAAAVPDEVWRRFKGGPERTLEHSERLVEVLATRAPEPLAVALRASLVDLRALVSGS